MSSDATTLPLRDPLLGDSDVAQRRRLIPLERRSPRDRSLAERAGRRETAIAVIALATILLCAAVIVLGGADRPSFLSAPSHTGFFPRWLAGPLGGLWPSFTRSPPVLKSLFTGALALMYVAYLLSVKYVPRLRARWAIAAIVGVHAIFLIAPPLALTDIFNYINYGRMGMLDHLNPYTTIPVLEPHTNPSFDLSNWHNLLSPYGPTFTLITYALVPLGIAGSLWSLKFLMVLASLATLLLVWRCARLLGSDPVRAIVLVGLNPIVLLWGLGGVHNDFLTVLCIVLGFYLLLRGGVDGVVPTRLPAPHPPAAKLMRRRLAGWLRRARAAALVAPAPLDVAAGAAFVTAMSLKASAGILVPVVLAGLLRAPRRLLGVILGMVGAALVLGAISLLAFGPHLPNLGTQGRLVIAVSIPNLLGLILGQGGETDTMRAVLSCALIAAVIASAVFAWRRRDSLTASGWATIALLVTLAWVLPWYILWVLPMTALSSSRRLRTASLVISAYLILTWMPLATAMNSALGFHPSKTPLGELHQRYVKELLN
jgi:alpha-1,6-mannosyltransferase